MRSRNRPGLLLMCHGDLPDAAMMGPECHRLYARCAEQYELMASDVIASHPISTVSGLNGHIAASLSSESDGPVEQASLGFVRPGLREATFRLLARGCRTIVCVGGAGLVLPGHGTSVHLPGAVRQVLAENAGLDVCCARPGINPHVAAGLVMASIERTLTGRGIPPGPSWEVPRIGDDTGVIVASAPGPPENPALARQLSDYLQAKPMAGPAAFTRYMTAAAEALEASGAFCAVRIGYLDYAVPDIATAAGQLTDAGAGQIIVSGMPALLGHHMLSFARPDEAVDRLKKKCPADLLYLKPDPEPCGTEIAAMLRMHVLEAASAARQQSSSPFS